MKSYRLFVLNGQGRIASAAREVRGTSDEDALARASEIVGTAPFEVWDRARRVGHAQCNDGRSVPVGDPPPSGDP